ncbi:PAS domain S-box protein [bacterium]|nr:MAG: PAS domain S-box protein [bacterium]
MSVHTMKKSRISKGRIRSKDQILLLHAAVEDTEDSVLITDANLEPPGPRIVFVNPGFSKMTGYTIDEVMGKSPRLMQGPKTDRKVLDRLKLCLENGEPFFGEVINYRKDGTEYFLEWHISPVRDDGGNITHFVSVQRDITERKRAEELRIQFQQQKARTAAIVETQEEERRRIAKELHDALGQMLVAAKFNVDILEEKLELTDASTRKRAADIKNLLNHIMLEVRRISYNLMPSILEDFGLPPALSQLCEQLPQNESLKIQFVCKGLEKRLPRIVEIGMYRIAQEALNNIIRHSNAHEATIQLIKDRKTVTLSIEDDGNGFIPDEANTGKQRRGMGLMNMRERAESIDASFYLDSRPGQGTEVIVQLKDNEK